jgi:hypothetical protein
MPGDNVTGGKQARSGTPTQRYARPYREGLASQGHSRTHLGQFAFDWEGTPTDAPTSPMTTPVAPASTIPTPAPPTLKRTLRETVERYLRDHSIPYINVDEAKKALFAGAKLRSFHFVVYLKDRKNWLVWAAQLRKESRVDLKQWEDIFGEGFVAVVAKQARDGALKFKTLAGEKVELE